MINGILGKKLEMTQKFTEDGIRIPLTRIQAGPCVVTDIKTTKRDGYQAVVLGFGYKRESRIKKPVLGKLKKAGVKKYPAFLREIRLEDKIGENLPAGRQVSANFKVGDLIKVGDIFKIGDLVNVSGISKGKGFAGVVKRWSFAGGQATHGQSDRLRAPGSIGGTTTPGRVFKGKKMAGHMGNVKKTILNLEVVGVDEKNNVLEVKGGVPGGREGLLVIRKSGKKQSISNK